ncbi:MAG: hypothetical protein AAGF76_10025 [Pseudomonadota bacterium]
MTKLTWLKCTGGVWCALERLNLETVTERGVYVIWHGGGSPRVVYVGQGAVANRLAEHRQNPEILAYRESGTLYVTWASALPHQWDGIERYLSDKYSPLVGDAHPNAQPIVVNDPW